MDLLTLGTCGRWLYSNLPNFERFFIVVFKSMKDRNKILCDYFCNWEEKFGLSLKPWHPNFNPVTEKFEKVPLWVRLPNFPLHLRFNSYLEAIGNSLGNFLMIDDDSSNLMHSTYAQILVEMEVTKTLLEEILINTSKGC